MFVGSLNGGPEGTSRRPTGSSPSGARTSSTGSEVKGRCQHPIIKGSGSGGFAGATGRVDFKDEVDTGEYFYRGHIALG